MGAKLYGNKGTVVFDEFITCEDIPKYVDQRLKEIEDENTKCTRCSSFNKTEGRCNLSLRESFTCKAYKNALFKTRKD